jgi:hypothetical protein
MTVLVSQSTTQSVSFDDSVAVSQGTATFCGTRSYSMTPSYSFLAISGTTLTLSTNAVTDAGPYNLDLTVGLVSYPAVATITVPLTVTISCQVLGLAYS